MVRQYFVLCQYRYLVFAIRDALETLKRWMSMLMPCTANIKSITLRCCVYCLLLITGFIMEDFNFFFFFLFLIAGNKLHARWDNSCVCVAMSVCFSCASLAKNENSGNDETRLIDKWVAKSVQQPAREKKRKARQTQRLYTTSQLFDFFWNTYQ